MENRDRHGGHGHMRKKKTKSSRTQNRITELPRREKVELLWSYMMKTNQNVVTSKEELDQCFRNGLLNNSLRRLWQDCVKENLASDRTGSQHQYQAQTAPVMVPSHPTEYRRPMRSDDGTALSNRGWYGGFPEKNPLEGSGSPGNLPGQLAEGIVDVSHWSPQFDSGRLLGADVSAHQQLWHHNLQTGMGENGQQTGANFSPVPDQQRPGGYPNNQTPTDGHPDHQVHGGYTDHQVQGGYPNQMNPAQYSELPMPDGFSVQPSPGGYPHEQSPGGYPDQWRPVGYPVGQSPGGYLVGQSPDEHPIGQSPGGCPDQWRPVGYPVGQSPGGYPVGQSPDEHPIVQNPGGCPDQWRPVGYPVGQSPGGYLVGQSPGGYPNQQMPGGNHWGQEAQVRGGVILSSPVGSPHGSADGQHMKFRQNTPDHATTVDNTSKSAAEMSFADNPPFTNPSAYPVCQHADVVQTAVFPSSVDYIWEELDAKRHGQFFINKVCLDSENRTWEPEFVKNSATQILDVQQLIPATDLKIAVVAEDSYISDFKEFSGYFQKDVNLTVICSSQQNNNTEIKKTVAQCPVHGQEGAEECGCPEAYSISVIHPRSSHKNLQCHFLLLRYSSFLRIIIWSSPFSALMWTYVCQFGWYCDLPISPTIPEKTENAEDKSTFEHDLKDLLNNLSLDHSCLLESVDFTVLSKSVKLISAVQGNCIGESCSHYGIIKLHSLIKSIPWPRQDPKMILCQTSRIGGKFGREFSVNILHGLCSKSRKNYDTKIVYPSEEFMRYWMIQPHIPAELKKLIFTHYRNTDRQRISEKCMHQPHISEPVLLHGNIYEQCQITADGKQLGWLLTGSFPVSHGSWGHLKNHQPEYRFERYGLAVGLFPYTYMDGEVTKCVSVDLKEISLPFEPNHLTPFKKTDTFFDPPTSGKDIFSFCCGRIDTVKNLFGFITPLPANHPLTSKYDEFNRAFIHADNCYHLGCDGRVLPINTVIEFFGIYSHIKDQYRARYVSKVFTSEELSQIGGSLHNRLEGRDTYRDHEDERKVVHVLQRRRSLTFADQMNQLGLHSDEQIEEYLQNKLNSPQVMNRGNFRMGHNDPMPEMTPTKVKADDAWLYDHVSKIYHGADRVEQHLYGPMADCNLSLLLDANRRESFIGL